MAALSIDCTITKQASKTSASATTSSATVQPVKFHRWKGWAPSLGTVVDREQRAGGNGQYAQDNGSLSPDVDLLGWRWESTKAAALTFAALVESLPSSGPYTMIDTWGRTMRVRIVKTSCNVAKVKGPVDGTTQTTHMIASTLTVERLPDA